MYYEKDYRICFPQRRIFISRDHNWAFTAWEIGRLRKYIKPRAALVHIDNHLDDLCPEMNIEEILNEDDAITIGSDLGIDEFIIPALANGTLGKILMISDHDVHKSEDTTLLRAYTLNHYEQIYKKNWNRATEDKSVILDLDLDFFNCNYRDYDKEGIIPTNEIITTQLEYIKSMMEWDMVTVALSPEFCGGDEICSHLFKLFLEVFDLDINEAEPW